MLAVPQIVQNKAVAAGAEAWLENLASLIAELESDWKITVGAPFGDATEAYVARATNGNGVPMVLKLVIPRAGEAARHEIVVLQIAGGRGCVELLRSDVARGALLMEQLGPSLAEQTVPIGERHRILCDAASRLWQPAPGSGLPTGAAKAEWLRDHIISSWNELRGPCSRAAVDHALRCVDTRLDAFDASKAVLVHGDVHQWNALASADGYKLVDPDGLVAEPEYDLGIIMSEDPLELLDDHDPRQRARWLADRTGCDVDAIWEWGVIERVSTGLLATKIGLQPVGRDMLHSADVLAAL